MNVSLTPELRQLVADKIESGLYTSASEVVREALRLLHERDRQRAESFARTKGKIDVGLRQLNRGEYRDFDAASLKEEFEAIKRGNRQAKKRSSRKK